MGIYLLYAQLYFHANITFLPLNCQFVDVLIHFMAILSRMLM